MIQRLLLTGAALLLAWPGWVWGLDIRGPREVTQHKLVRLESSVAPALDKDSKESTRFSWTVDGSDEKGRPIEADAVKINNLLIFTGPPGSYKVKLTVVDFDKRIFDEATAVVKITSRGPGPGPGPDPDPPDPDPDPDPPEPNDPLYAALREAYRLDTGKSKSGYVLQLSALYKVVSRKLDTWKTAGEMDADIKSARRDVGIGDDDLVGVRRIIGGEMARFMPTGTDETITADHRAKAKTLFEKLQTHLEVLSKLKLAPKSKGKK